MELEALSALRAEFRARGWHHKATARVVAELCVHVMVVLGGIAIFVLAEHWALRAIGMIISTIGSVGVGTNTHTASHYAASKSRFVNDVLCYFGYPFFLQLGATYWRHQHIVVHHPNPNVMGADDDADFSPFFASTDREVLAARGGFRKSLRWQFLTFPMIVWVHCYIRQIKSWGHVVKMLRDPERRRPGHYADAVAMALHWVAWFIIPSFFFPWTHVVLFNLLRIGLLGYPLYAVLAPGHYPAAAPVIAKGNWEKDFVFLQTATTLNYRTGLIGGFVSSGLQYQIEHHLFPGYCHVYYSRMSPFVKKFCEEHGYPHKTLGWGEALWECFRIFYRPKHVTSNMAELRQALEQPLQPTTRELLQSSREMGEVHG
jgi:linoleoyl-CoA desaturase